MPHFSPPSSLTKFEVSLSRSIRREKRDREELRMEGENLTRRNRLLRIEMEERKGTAGDMERRRGYDVEKIEIEEKRYICIPD